MSLRTFVALLCLASAPAAAQPMPDAMHAYFAGESRTGYLMGAVGTASVASGIGLLFTDSRAAHGAAVPIIAVGAIQLAISVGLIFRTGGQVARLDAQLAQTPAEYAEAERTRMARVNRNWRIYKSVEVGLFFAGLGLAGGGGLGQSDFALGAGLALASEALVMLLVDLFAELRGHAYETALLGFRW